MKVWCDGDQLRYSAPDGALTAELLAEMKAGKPELIRHLHEEALAALVDAIETAEARGDSAEFTRLVREAKALALQVWPHRADTIPAIRETLPAAVEVA